MRPEEGGSDSAPESLSPASGSIRASVRLFAVVFLGFATGAMVSAEVFGVATASAFFPPAGITVAAMLLTRRSLWPVIAAAIVLAELAVDAYHGLALPMAAVYAGVNVVEPLIGASLVLAWCGGTPDLRRTRDLILFVAGAVLIAPAIAGVLSGGLSAWLYGASWTTAGLQLFAGDGIAVLVVGAPILLWPKQSHILKDRPAESAGILAGAAVLSVIGFTLRIPPTITVLPILAWAALRLGMLGAALAGTLVAAVGNFLTGTNHGLIAGMDASPMVKVSVAQAFVGVTVLTALLIAQEVAKRTTAVTERDVARGERLRLESLSELAQMLSAARTPQDVNRALELQLLDGVGATSFSLGVLNPDRDRLMWVAVAGDPPPAPVRGGLDAAASWVATDVARSGEPVLIRSAADYASRYPDTAGVVRSCRNPVGRGLATGLGR